MAPLLQYLQAVAGSGSPCPLRVLFYDRPTPALQSVGRPQYRTGPKTVPFCPFRVLSVSFSTIDRRRPCSLSGPPSAPVSSMPSRSKVFALSLAFSTLALKLSRQFFVLEAAPPKLEFCRGRSRRFWTFRLQLIYLKTFLLPL